MSYLAFILIFGALYLESSGLPKNINHEWRNVEEAKVIKIVFDEPRAIHVWIFRENEHTPTAYSLPWNEKVAKQAQEAEGASKEKTNAGYIKMTIRKNYDSSISSERPMFWAPPQQSLPDKKLESQASGFDNYGP